MTPSETVAQQAARLKVVADELGKISTALLATVAQIPPPVVVPTQPQPTTVVVDGAGVEWSVDNLQHLLRNGVVVPDSWVKGFPFLIAGQAYHEGSKGVYMHKADGTFPLVKDPRTTSIAQVTIPGTVKTA